MASLHIIYASTTGHTEYVIETLCAHLHTHSPHIRVSVQRAEIAEGADLLTGDVLLLACGSWNTESIEGQLNPHMHYLLKKRAAGNDLGGKKVALIGLGDERYHFTAGALVHLQEYVKTHNGKIIDPVLRIVNEPYGQEQAVTDWAATLATHLL